jgi:hypothetical protein
LPKLAKRARLKSISAAAGDCQDEKRPTNMDLTGVISMDQKQVFKQMLQYNKSVMETTFSSMSMLQDQMERTTKTFFDQAAWLPAEGKKVIEEWVKACKKGRENFKDAVDEGFKKVEAFLVETKKG